MTLASGNAIGALSTIAQRAESCLHTFQKCLDKTTTLDARQVSLFEDQLARFSLWASNIRVFSAGRASLDHRLREAPDVKDAVLGLLEALEYRIQTCATVIESYKSKETLEADQGNRDLEEAAQALGSEITLLNKFSNTIRRAGKRTNNSKADEKFRIRDDEGNDVEPLLQALFSNFLRDRFPGANDVLRERLSKSMVLRRKRILYRRERYGMNPIQTLTTLAQPIIRRPRPETMREPMSHAEESSKGGAIAEADELKSAPSIAPTATTLSQEMFKRVSAPSIVSTAKSVAISTHGDLSFPPSPCLGLIRRFESRKRQLADDQLKSHSKADENFPSAIRRNIHDRAWYECVTAVGEVVCPFCFHLLPVEEAANEAKWRTHVKNDLDAYVCLFDECNSSDELYTHGHLWRSHMREHAVRWKCSSKSHSQTFHATTKEEYISHLKTAHGSKLGEEQIKILADRNGKVLGPLFVSCPLCGMQEIKEGIEAHITGHLRFLALKSLPSYEDENVDQNDGDESGENEWDSSDEERSDGSRKRSSVATDEWSKPPSFDGLFLEIFERDPSEWEFLVETEQTGDSDGLDPILQHFADAAQTSSQSSSSIAPSDALSIGETLPFDESEEDEEEEEDEEGDDDHDDDDDDGDDYEGDAEDAKDDHGGGDEIQLQAFQSFWKDSAWNSLKGVESDTENGGSLGSEADWEKQLPKMAQEYLSRKMEPDCAFCDAAAVEKCHCEAEFLDIRMKSAEEKILEPLCTQARGWVRTHALNSILNTYRSELARRSGLPLRGQTPMDPATNRALKEPRKSRYLIENEDGLNPKPMEEGLTRNDPRQEVEDEGLEGEAQKASQRVPDKHRIWRDACGEFPVVIEHFFKQVILSLPEDDDPAVRKPALPWPTPREGQADASWVTASNPPGSPSAASGPEAFPLIDEVRGASAEKGPEEDAQDRRRDEMFEKELSGGLATTVKQPESSDPGTKPDETTGAAVDAAIHAEVQLMNSFQPRAQTVDSSMQNFPIPLETLKILLHERFGKIKQEARPNPFWAMEKNGKAVEEQMELQEGKTRKDAEEALEYMSRSRDESTEEIEKPRAGAERNAEEERQP